MLGTTPRAGRQSRKPIHEPMTIAPALEPATTAPLCRARFRPSSRAESASTSSRWPGSPPVRYTRSASSRRDTFLGSSASADESTISGQASAPSRSKCDTPLAAAIGAFCSAAAVGMIATRGRSTPVESSSTLSIDSQFGRNSFPPTSAMRPTCSSSGTRRPRRPSRPQCRRFRVARKDRQPTVHACPCRQISRRAGQMHRWLPTDGR